MNYTEEEAKKKWCPFVRLAGIQKVGEANVLSPGPAFNRYVKLNATAGLHEELNSLTAKCIASECMAWRWDYDYSSATEEGQGGDVVLRLRRRIGEPCRGYCGLAGGDR